MECYQYDIDQYLDFSSEPDSGPASHNTTPDTTFTYPDELALADMGSILGPLDLPDCDPPSLDYYTTGLPNYLNSTSAGAAGTDEQQPALFAGVQLLEAAPRCWLHGCAGRSFSSVSNYRRHCKEKDGSQGRIECSRCGQRFSRWAAQREHVSQLRCKVRRYDANGVAFWQSLHTAEPGTGLHHDDEDSRGLVLDTAESSNTGVFSSCLDDWAVRVGDEHGLARCRKPRRR